MAPYDPPNAHYSELDVSSYEEDDILNLTYLPQPTQTYPIVEYPKTYHTSTHGRDSYD